MHCPRAPTLEPSKWRRPQNRHSQKRKAKRTWCPVSCLSWLARLGFLSRARVSGSFFFFFRSLRVSVFSFSFCFFTLAAGVTFQLPEGGTSGQTHGYRPTQEKVEGADPRTGPFRYPFTRDCLAYLVAPVLFFVFLFATLFLCITTGVTMGIAKHSGYS